MLRLVLGVALAAALVAAVTPALDGARATRTERLAERELDRVAAAATTLAAEDAPGARRTLTVSLPARSPTSAPLAVVALGGVPDGELPEGDPSAVTDSAERDVFAFRVADAPRQVRRVGTDLRAVRDGAVAESDAAVLVLRGGKTYKVTLRLVPLDGRRTVVVSAEAR
ncbi:hypothetical protein M0R89_12275 [Halorussus limi]|uniref:DUF7311 domain-containing protein n=1 Tax=Halorussus limi TaxID=2938695 RepID=A0A8U0HQV0_9EURY|nr:hypothetical protein [Halorussus limi]UPV73320.1 hypothetical protein M0R89_12275 [Halorussus limi]